MQAQCFSLHVSQVAPGRTGPLMVGGDDAGLDVGINQDSFRTNAQDNEQEEQPQLGRRPVPQVKMGHVVYLTSIVTTFQIQRF